jgi:phage terminase large subunit
VAAKLKTLARKAVTRMATDDLPGVKKVQRRLSGVTIHTVDDAAMVSAEEAMETLGATLGGSQLPKHLRDIVLNQQRNVHARIELLKAAKSDTAVQVAEWDKCRASFEYWCDTYGWTVDPREFDAKTLPFVLFKRQKQFVAWIRSLRRGKLKGICEKSRDMGVTWLCVMYALWCWLFEPGFTALFVSRQLELVDKIDDPDTIFEKFRQALYRLPRWMLPAGFKKRVHDKFKSIRNPSNGATITAKGGDNPGRGGRASIVFVDEAAFLLHPEAVYGAISKTSDCIVSVSTVNGIGNLFYRMRFSDKFPVFIFDWRQDPRKDEAWYQKQLDEAEDESIVAREVDRDYAASVEQVIIPGKWVRACVGFRQWFMQKTGVDIMLGHDGEGGMDVSGSDAQKAWTVVTARWGPVIAILGAWRGKDETTSAHDAADLVERYRCRRLTFDYVGVGEGIMGAWRGSERQLQFIIHPLNGQNKASNAEWPNGKRSHQFIKNIRTENWWVMRERARKSYEMRVLGKDHDPEDCLSLEPGPYTEKFLVPQLSQPKYGRAAGSGKLALETKEQMKTRNVPSPDFGDAAAYSCAPERPERQIPPSTSVRNQL